MFNLSHSFTKTIFLNAPLKCVYQLNSCVFFCLLKDKRMFFGLSTRRWSKMLKQPPRVHLKFDDGSFEPIKNSKIVFTGSLTGSGSEIHRFYQATEVIWVEATSSCSQFLLRISGSLKNVDLSFKRRKRTQLLSYQLKLWYIQVVPVWSTSDNKTFYVKSKLQSRGINLCTS